MLRLSPKLESPNLSTEVISKVDRSQVTPSYSDERTKNLTKTDDQVLQEVRNMYPHITFSLIDTGRSYKDIVKLEFFRYIPSESGGFDFNGTINVNRTIALDKNEIGNQMQSAAQNARRR